MAPGTEAMNDRDSLTKCSSHCGGGDGYRLPNRGVATEGQLSHRTVIHSDSTQYSRPILERSGLVQLSTTTPYRWQR